MVEVLCIVLSILFLINALLHLLLILGLPLGEYVLGGKYTVLPAKIRLISFLFLILWAFVAINYLNYGQLIDVPMLKKIDRNFIIIITIFLFFAMFSNVFRQTVKKSAWL